ncbi:GNAT family N-acetyltransferase [Streptomyces sp. NBC_01498]|uniref:GNAT family N-acetyltransferase n=1 Tax=Streptomyces sp. NBC_01498 TaxID=2975870 RepID=UPI002E7B57FB|nr:GNAT family N-acetyltransferase [Streptomyces sp. NBC_01498]WTL23773.1 GNAT family N-acetyltransferase [Streptomyces sp. NBC_01498]
MTPGRGPDPAPAPPPATDPFLLTARLRLRDCAEADLDRLLALDNDPGVKRFIDGGMPAAPDTFRAEALPRLLGRGFWAAEERATGAFLGWFELRPLNDTGWEAVELGYRLHRAVWGRGYATEGARALVRKAFTELGTRQVTATTMTVNGASRRVMEKAGLRHIRTYVEEWPEVIEGSEHGDVEYALTREEWMCTPAS